MHEETPTKGTRVNVEGFVNTVDQARQDGCDTVVYASTSSIYGNRTEPSRGETSVRHSSVCYHVIRVETPHFPSEEN